MKHPLLLALSLAPLACAGAATTRAVTVDLGTPPPAASAAPPAAEKKMTREEALREAAEYGMIGLVNTDPAPDGTTTVKGGLSGGDIGDAFGAGGLGLTGTAGGGTGLGSIGTLGHGAGTGFGGAGVHAEATSVSGRLPPEVIQRIVRQSYPRFRRCYEDGLRSNAKLEGKVSVKFTIGRDGAVAAVSGDDRTTMPDKKVVACVAAAFSTLAFPQPAGGIVVVVYPIVFKPGDDGATAAP